jgi:hypothetical protein
VEVLLVVHTKVSQSLSEGDDHCGGPASRLTQAEKSSFLNLGFDVFTIASGNVSDHLAYLVRREELAAGGVRGVQFVE